MSSGTAIGRIYNTTVALEAVSEDLLKEAARHEKRLDRAEVTIQAILDELKQLRRNSGL